MVDAVDAVDVADGVDSVVQTYSRPSPLAANEL